jgi:hypothetical protein
VLTFSVVMLGNMNLNLGRSMTISPDIWNNNCISLSHGQSSPAVYKDSPKGNEKSIHFRPSHFRFPPSLLGISSGAPDWINLTARSGFQQSALDFGSHQRYDHFWIEPMRPRSTHVGMAVA